MIQCCIGRHQFIHCETHRLLVLSIQIPRVHIYIYILSETCHNVIIFGNRMKQKIAGPFIISIHLLFMVLLCVIHRILRKKKHLRLARTELFALCAQQLNLLDHYVVLLAVATTLSCKFENSAKKSCNNRHRLHWVVYPADNDRYNKSKQLMPFFRLLTWDSSIL